MSTRRYMYVTPFSDKKKQIMPFKKNWRVEKTKTKTFSRRRKNEKKSSFRIRKRLDEIFEFLVFEFEFYFWRKMIHDRDKPTTFFSYFLLREVFSLNAFKWIDSSQSQKNWKTFNEKNISFKEVKQNSSSLEKKKMMKTTNKEKRLSM